MRVGLGLVLVAGLSGLAGGARGADAGAAAPRVAPDAGAADVDVDLSAGPRALTAIEPKYSAEAMKAGVAGDVALVITLDDLGAVKDVAVESGLPGGLTEAAIEAARAARFLPARDRAGRPIPVRIRWIVHFTLPEVRKPAAPGAPAPASPAVAPLPPNVERLTPGAGGVLAVQVRERGTGKLLTGASVWLEDVSELIHLDSQARAERALPAGAYVVVLRAPGHEQEERIERLHMGERLERTYFVLKTRLHEYETIIQAAPPRAETGVVTLQAEEIHDIPGTFGDPFRAAMLLPGVASAFSGLGYPIIRGEAPGQTGTFIDDVKVPLLYHLGFGPAVVHPLFLDSLDFHPGNFPAEWGRFTGGLIRAKTTAAPTERQTMLEADLFKLSAFHAQPLTIAGHEATISAAARYGTLAFLARAFDPNAVLSYWDFQVRGDTRAGPGALRLFIFGASDAVGSEAYSVTETTTTTVGPDGTISTTVVGPNGTSTSTIGGGGPGPAPGTSAATQVNVTRVPEKILRTGFVRADLRYRLFRRGRVSGDVGVEVGPDFTTNSDPGSRLRLVEWIVRPRATVDVAMGPRLKLRGGVDTLYQTWAFRIQDADFRDLFFPRFTLTPGAFVQAEWQPTPEWLIAPGVRFDYYSYTFSPDPAWLGETRWETSVDPRLAVRRRLRAGLFIKGGLGIFHSPPRFLVPWPGLEGFGLRENGLNESWQASLGAEARLPGDVSIDGQVYANWLRRVSEFTLDTAAGERVDPQGRQNDGPRQQALRGRAYGLELIARRRLGHRLFGWLAYTLARSERDTPYGWRPADFDQTTLINAVVAYALGRSWTVSGVFHYNTGRPVTPDVASTNGPRRPLPGDEFDAVRNTDRLPSFWRIDARIEKREAFDTWYLAFYVDWLNISLRSEVVEYLYTQGPDGQITHQARRGPVLTIPTMGLRAEF